MTCAQAKSESSASRSVQAAQRSGVFISAPAGGAATYLLGRHDSYRVLGRNRNVVRRAALLSLDGSAKLLRALAGTAERDSTRTEPKRKAGVSYLHRGSRVRKLASSRNGSRRCAAVKGQARGSVLVKSLRM